MRVRVQVCRGEHHVCFSAFCQHSPVPQIASIFLIDATCRHQYSQYAAEAKGDSLALAHKISCLYFIRRIKRHKARPGDVSLRSTFHSIRIHSHTSFHQATGCSVRSPFGLPWGRSQRMIAGASVSIALCTPKEPLSMCTGYAWCALAEPQGAAQSVE